MERRDEHQCLGRATVPGAHGARGIVLSVSDHSRQRSDLTPRLALQQDAKARAAGRLRINEFAQPVTQLISSARCIIDDHQRWLVPGPTRDVLERVNLLQRELPSQELLLSASRPVANAPRSNGAKIGSDGFLFLIYSKTELLDLPMKFRQQVCRAI